MYRFFTVQNVDFCEVSMNKGHQHFKIRWKDRHSDLKFKASALNQLRNFKVK